MKSIKYFSKYLWILPLAIASACSDDTESLVAPDDFTGEVPSEITLTLAVPDYTVTEIGSRAAEDVSISKITVLCYSNTNALLSSQAVTSGWTSKGNGQFEITVPIDRQTRSVQFVTNATIPAGTADLSTVFSTDPNASVLWGRADIKDIVSKPASSHTVAMLRHNAKVTVSNKAAGFTVNRFGVYGTAANGSVAPAGATANPTAPTIKSGEAYNFNMASPASHLASASSAVNVFETTKDATVDASKGLYTTRGRIIIEGTYNGVKGYYVVAFRTRSGSGNSETPGAFTYTPIDVLRNHNYVVTVDGVRAEGWPTIEEALKAEPDNRLTVLITDKNADITDVVATRDYELGVSDKVSVSCDDVTAVISVVTSWNPSDGSPRISLADDSNWIKTEGINTATLSATTTDMGTDRNSSGYLYKISVPIDANNSSEARTGYVTVRSGELSRTVTITQGARDYIRDNKRAIVLEGLPGGTIYNYFTWLDACNGVTPEQNRGKVRNAGLHFPAVPAYTLTYRIPALSTDKSCTVTSGAFNVTKSGNYYVVTATGSTTGIYQGKLRIVNDSNVNIDYDLYHTGYFHQLTQTMATNYQPEDQNVVGWFYYEAVLAPGGKYILDRNLGASSNSPYISTYSGFKNNADAMGAYFKIATQKSSSANNPLTIISNLSTSNFKIPTEEQVKAWGITTRNVSATTGETAMIASISVSSGLVADNVVYIPHGGYYEATSQKYETHANIWTRTLLSGNQGFDPVLSPEFGYWYLYLDVYGTKVNVGQMRFANGSGGQAPDASSVFKYMPIRLIWEP